MQLSKKLINCLETNLNTTIIGLSAISGGSINDTYHIKTPLGPFFLKLNRSVPDCFFRREAEGLEALRTSSHSLYIPKVEFYGKEEESGDLFLLMEWLDNGPQQPAYDDQLGEGLAELHTNSHSSFGWSTDNYCGLTRQSNQISCHWTEFYQKQRLYPLFAELKSNRHLNYVQLSTLEKLIERIPELLMIEVEPPALIHGDLWYGNILSNRHGHPCLIDPAVSYSHREAELGMMSLFGGFSHRVWDSYKAHYPLQAQWEDRLPLYRLYHILNHCLLFRGHYGDQAFQIAKHYVG